MVLIIGSFLRKVFITYWPTKKIEIDLFCWFYKVFGAEKSKGKASIHDFQMVMSIFQKTEVADTI
jgi:hypothetical protein